MKIRLATIYLHDGKLVVDKQCKMRVQVKISGVSRKRFGRLARVIGERQRIAGLLCGGLSIRKQTTEDGSQNYVEKKCNSVASGIRLRVKLNSKNLLRKPKARTKRQCLSGNDRLLLERDKIKTRHKNADRNKDKWFCKCISISHNMKVRCGLSKYNCVTAKQLHELLIEQDFKCGLTGEQLCLDPEVDNARVAHKVAVSRGGASMKEDVMWVHKDVNAAQGQMSNEEFIELCRKVVAWADRGDGVPGGGQVLCASGS